MNKSITIPPLELLGNFILSNLIRSVYNSLSEEIFIEKLIFWADSFISLSWIKAVNQEFKLTLYQVKMDKYVEYYLERPGTL